MENGNAPNRHSVTLESGKVVVIRLPYMQDCILAAEVPLPVIKKMREREALRKANDDLAEAERKELPEPSPEEMLSMRRVRREIVARAVVKVDDITVNLATADLEDYLTEDEFDEVANYADRTTPLPKATSAPTS